MFNFLNCKIDLSKKIFIPRDETKFWVKKALKICQKEIEKKKIKKVKVLDIFSGSGWIGIVILKNLENSFVDFVDIDEKAIEQIKINLKLNRIFPKRFEIIRSDIFEGLEGKKYNFIFANPPYVAKERLFQVQESVKKQEPKISWFGGKRGMKYIKKFLRDLKDKLEKDGIAFLEFDPFQKEEIEKILRKKSFKEISFYKDQFKKYRWAKIIFSFFDNK